ncbi:hypothetical protein N0V93_004105 [Gnomoniopsis smithogilvyi]|uniref:Uncharacterized protein n=1 Tax=Gnomoniopsis smithogilvyi TaxID=1191159 RepID=A0A9W9CZA0_9PEZI|nr:hypothetical protein N0V93_004105 [Gnomoniopsis smithogilvyi]
MEGMLWGVAAMVIKDAVKQPYLKGRDYERNVRQVYRDIDNLKITMDHVKVNCQDEDLEHGPYAPFIKRAERQLKDAYRTLKKSYPRKAGLSFLAQYASTPGAEMHLLDIGKEANQTARGLGDLLSEIRFSKIGGKPADDQSPPQDSNSGSASSPQERVPSRSVYDMAVYEHAVSDDSSTGSEQSSLFDRDRDLIRPLSGHSPSSSHSSHPRKRSNSSRRTRSQSTNGDRKALPSSPFTKPQRLDVILEGGAEREHALDNLQISIDNVLDSVDEEHEGEAMEQMEHALAEVLRIQKAQGFAGSEFDEDLGDAVEDLDESMKSLLGAKSEKEKKYSLKRLSHALEDVDHALAERQKYKERVAERRLKQLAAGPADRDMPTQKPTRGKLRRQNTGTDKKSRRYSMYK